VLAHASRQRMPSRSRAPYLETNLPRIQIADPSPLVTGGAFRLWRP